MARLIKLAFRHPEARSVSVAGDFNDWDVSVCPMSFDPDLDWVRETWPDLTPDPRVPLVGR